MVNSHIKTFGLGTILLLFKIVEGSYECSYNNNCWYSTWYLWTSVCFIVFFCCGGCISYFRRRNRSQPGTVINNRRVVTTPGMPVMYYTSDGKPTVVQPGAVQQVSMVNPPPYSPQYQHRQGSSNQGFVMGAAMGYGMGGAYSGPGYSGGAGGSNDYGVGGGACGWRRLWRR